MWVVLLVMLSGVEPRPVDPPVRRGVIPWGLSVNGGLGVAEQFTVSAGWVTRPTWELGVSVDLTPQWVLTAELALKAGVFSTGAQFRFLFSGAQRIVPRLGLALAVTAADTLGLGAQADLGVEFRLAPGVSIELSARYAVTGARLLPAVRWRDEPLHQLRQTVGLRLSL